MVRIVSRAVAGGQGFIALMTVIILSAALMTIAMALNEKAYSTRAEILASEFKQRSVALAEACGDTALLRVSANRAYSGNETIAVGSASCRINSVSTVAGKVTALVSASFQDAVTRLSIRIDSSNFTVEQWQEIP